MAEPTDRQLWRGVEATVRDVLLPSIADDWARVAAVQLVGLAQYAQQRPDDRLPARAAELRAVLEELASNPIVGGHPLSADDSDVTLFASVGAVLAEAVGHHDPDADEIRSRLRPVVRRQLDDELATTGMLMPYFRGQLPDA